MSHAAFHVAIYIFDRDVKIIHISTVNISQTMINRTNIAITNSYEVVCGHSICILTVDLDPF